MGSGNDQNPESVPEEIQRKISRKVSLWGKMLQIGPDGGAVAKSSCLEDDFLVVTIDTEEVRGARFSSPLLRGERIDLIVAEIDRLGRLKL